MPKTLDVYAIFGGSFNPPHIGHLQSISRAAEEFGISTIKLLLSPQPPHKQINDVSLQQRIDMLKLACSEYPRCEADFTEIELPSPSYTVTTLRYLRAQHPSKSIVFFLGSDSLMNIHTWHEWECLLEYAHLVVLPRPNYSNSERAETLEWIHSVQQANVSMMKQHTNGSLFFAETPLWDVSSTEIRHAINESVDTDREQNQKILKLMPPSVAAYIVKHNLYKPTAKIS